MKNIPQVFWKCTPSLFFVTSSWHSQLPLKHGRIKGLCCQLHPKSHACEGSPQMVLMAPNYNSVLLMITIICTGEEITDVHIFWPLHILAFIKKSVLSPKHILVTGRLTCHQAWPLEGGGGGWRNAKRWMYFSPQTLYLSPSMRFIFGTQKSTSMGGPFKNCLWRAGIFPRGNVTLSSPGISDQCTITDHVQLPHFFELELMAH